MGQSTSKNSLNKSGTFSKNLIKRTSSITTCKEFRKRFCTGSNDKILFIFNGETGFVINSDAKLAHSKYISAFSINKFQNDFIKNKAHAKSFEDGIWNSLCNCEKHKIGIKCKLFYEV